MSSLGHTGVVIHLHMWEENYSKSFILILTFFVLTPLALATSIFALATLHPSTQSAQVLAQSTDSVFNSPQPGVQVFAALPDTVPTVSVLVEAKDARTEIVKQYLKKYRSPLEPYADYIIQSADKYGVDFRLVTAIAQQESNLCKRIPDNTFNCWGWGIHSRGTLGFTSYQEGIETVTRGIKHDYLNKGYNTVEAIMSKYTPLSNGSWAEGVAQFMGEME